MQTVNIYLHSTINRPGRVTGAGGYVLELDRGEQTGQQDAKNTAVQQILPIIDMTSQEAQLYLLREAGMRLRQKVTLRIYSNLPQIERAVRQGWLETWIRNDWIGSKGDRVKNADSWQRLLTCFEALDIDLTRAEWHTGEQHPYAGLLEWEARRKAHELRQRHRTVS